MMIKQKSFPGETEEEKNEPNRKKRWRMRQRRLGNCIKCGQKSDRIGKDYCALCLIEQKGTQKRWRERQIKKGNCQGCGKPNDRKFKTNCSACVKRALTYRIKQKII